MAQLEHVICKLDEIVYFKTSSSPEGVYLPTGITCTRNLCEFCTTRTKNFCELCTTFIPVPETSVRSVRPCHIPGVRVQHFHTAAPKVSPHARACAHTRPRHRRGVGERPHVRGSVERTASLAVAKTRCSFGQTRWTCELRGLYMVYHPKRWPAEGTVLFRPIMWLYSASVVLVCFSCPPYTQFTTFSYNFLNTTFFKTGRPLYS